MNSEAFQTLFTYEGTDLGNTYTAGETKFVVWAPTASQVDLITYPSAASPAGDGAQTTMTKGDNGTWNVTLSGDQKGLVATCPAADLCQLLESLRPVATRAVFEIKRCLHA